MELHTDDSSYAEVVIQAAYDALGLLSEVAYYVESYTDDSSCVEAVMWLVCDMSEEAYDAEPHTDDSSYVGVVV